MLLSNDGKLALAVTIDETLDLIEAFVAREAPLDGAFPELQEQILGFVGNLRHLI